MNPSQPRRRGLLIGGGVIALLVAVTLTVLVVRSGVNSGDQAGPAHAEAAAAAAELRVTAEQLATTPAIRYTGTFLGPHGESTYDIDARVTSAGTLLGKVTGAGQDAEVLGVGDRTFVRADSSFWFWAGVHDERKVRFVHDWVLVPENFFGVVLSARLAPTAMAAAMSPVVSRPAGSGSAPSGPAGSGPPGSATVPVRGTPASVDGVEARPVRVGDVLFQVSTAEPKRLVHVTATPPKDGLRLDLALTPLDGTARKAFFGELRQETAGLESAMDIAADIVGKSEMRFTPCDATDCVIWLPLINRVKPDAKYVSARPVPTDVTIIVTVRGKQVQRCTRVVEIEPGDTSSAICIARFRNRGSADVYAVWTSNSRALPAAAAGALGRAVESELTSYEK